MSNAIRSAEPDHRPYLRSLSIPAALALAGFALGAGLAQLFWALYGNWQRLPAVDGGAGSTVPYWTVQFLGPILVSVCWTGLLLQARQVRRWQAWTASVSALQLALLVAGLLPIALAGNGGVVVSGPAQLAVVLVALASPITAVFLPRGAALSQGWSHLLAAMTFAAGLWLGQSIWAPQTLLI